MDTNIKTEKLKNLIKSYNFPIKNLFIEETLESMEADEYTKTLPEEFQISDNIIKFEQCIEVLKLQKAISDNGYSRLLKLVDEIREELIPVL